MWMLMGLLVPCCLLRPLNCCSWILCTDAVITVKCMISLNVKCYWCTYTPVEVRCVDEIRFLASEYAALCDVRYNMLFLLTGAGKFNYQGTKKWLDDQIESGGKYSHSRPCGCLCDASTQQCGMVAQNMGHWTSDLKASGSVPNGEGVSEKFRLFVAEFSVEIDR